MKKSGTKIVSNEVERPIEHTAYRLYVRYTRTGQRKESQCGLLILMPNTVRTKKEEDVVRKTTRSHNTRNTVHGERTYFTGIVLGGGGGDDTGSIF